MDELPEREIRQREDEIRRRLRGWIKGAVRTTHNAAVLEGVGLSAEYGVDVVGPLGEKTVSTSPGFAFAIGVAEHELLESLNERDLRLLLDDLIDELEQIAMERAYHSGKFATEGMSLEQWKQDARRIIAGGSPAG